MSDAPKLTLLYWLLTEGRTAPDIPTLLEAFGEQLQRYTSAERIWYGTRLLHPQTAAYIWIWTANKPVIERELGYARFAELRSTIDSPARRLERGAPSVRFRNDGGESADIPDVAALWERGYTDLFGLSVRFRSAWVGGVTWSTRAPGGFSDTEIDLMEAIAPALEAVIEPLCKDLVTSVLLKTYLGRDAGERVFQGQVQRGDGETLETVVWFSDVRGFTQLSSELDRDALLDLLNDHFELVVRALGRHGGEVLKFMGDGLLGVFPVVDGDRAAACRAARAAALSFREELAILKRRRIDAGLRPAEVGVALHFGDVAYGNIGAPDRLDFTVIGPAVNLSARIESLCGKLGHPILASQTFVALEGGDWIPCGSHALKGVAQPVAVSRPARGA